MRPSNHSIAALLLGLAWTATCGLGCGPGQSQPRAPDQGHLRAGLTAVPDGVACIRITSYGQTTLQRVLPLTPGPGVSLDVLLPVGPQTLVADAFPVACPATGAHFDVNPTWTSDAVFVRLEATTVTPISLTLYRTSNAELGIDFATDGHVGLLSAGSRHTCAILDDGAARCWGTSVYDQGGSFAIQRPHPTPVAGLPAAAALRDLDTGNEFTCAVRGDGTAHCMGLGELGQLGGSVADFGETDVDGVTSAVRISAGGSHTCALLLSGAVVCFGANQSGQLGDGTNQGPLLGGRQQALPVVGLGPALAVAAGGSHSCALGQDQHVYCWGQNGRGQLGDGTTTDRYRPVQVVGLGGVAAVSAGQSFTCALLFDGSLACWGANESGQLGDGTTVDRSVAVPVSGLAGATAVAAGSGHTCAVLGDGTARCFGAGGSGQLGNGSTSNSSTPQPVSGLRRVQAISAGTGHTCALSRSGGATCWGANDWGQLGDGTLTNRTVPAPVVF